MMLKNQGIFMTFKMITKSCQLILPIDLRYYVIQSFFIAHSIQDTLNIALDC